MQSNDASRTRSRLQLGSRLGVLGFVAMAAFFLLTEHRAHLFGALPFVLVLLCPLLHLLLHGRHRGAHSGHRASGVHRHEGEEQ